MSGYTRTLSELRRADEPAFGGKSAGLGELLAAGLRVPAGFALACSAYRLARRDPPMPELVREEIARRYAELGETVGVPSPPVAVRSSAVGEDSAEATFAGQQESVLWVCGPDAVCDAVRTCWASLHSPTAVAYRARLDSSHADPTIGVTVQSMVEANVAGVLFTCNPVTGDPSVVAINASWGLGVAVAGGEVTPDDYLVSKVTGEILRERLGSKAVEYVRDPQRGRDRAARGGTGATRCPRARRAHDRGAGRHRARDRAPLRRPAGRRVGDRGRWAVRAPVPAGDGAARAPAAHGAGVRAVAGDEDVRSPGVA